ncbi:MAG: mobile mystery protein A [Bacteroidota bacterium]
MNNKFRKLQLETLDKQLAKVQTPARPANGWVRAIRDALCMSGRQLASRMGVSQQALSQLENKEVNDAVTLKLLRRAAEAMHCKVAYVLVPAEGSLQDIITAQAYQKATSLVTAVDHTMKLEAQGVGDVEEKTRQVAEELVLNLNTDLWD